MMSEPEVAPVPAEPANEAVTTESTTPTPVPVEAVPADPPVEPVTEAPAESVPINIEAYGLDNNFGETLKAFAADSQLSQEKVDGLVSAYQKTAQDATLAQQTAMRAEGEAFVESWGEAKEDNLAIVRESLKAVDEDGSVTKMLNESGYGNHPAILQMFLKIGDHLKEGGFLKSATNSPAAPLTAAQAMYGQTHPTH